MFEWRFGESDEKGTPPVTSPVQRIVGSIENCAKPESKLVNLQEAKGGPLFWNDTKLTQFMSNLDHIYVVCVLCKREVPAALLDKTSNINGKQADRCVPNDGHKWNKVTGTHKLAVAHAKLHNYKNILIVEEDATFDTDLSGFDMEPIRKLMVDPNQEWEILRLGWYNVGGSLASGDGSCGCQCTKNSAQNMCQTEPSSRFPCRAHSSAGYVLSERAYDDFMTCRKCNGGDQVDVHLINQFKNQVYVHPAILHQPGYVKREKAGEYSFIKNCLDPAKFTKKDKK